MHVDWNWVKQRPHFIAEMIEKNSEHKVIVMYRMAYQKKLLVNNECLLANRPLRIPKLPHSSKYKLILRINTFIESIIVARKVKKCDVVYVTHPTFFPSIRKVKGKKIIYDCMDNILGFPQSEKMKMRTNHYEKELIKKSDITLFSASHLKKTVEKRTDFLFYSIVINNAINIPQEINLSNIEPLKHSFARKSKKIISYIGTISEWFDYNLLIEITQLNQSIIFYLFGPADARFPPNENIIFFGPQKHQDIFYIMNESDALIMPFQVNELIRSVNPVKMYEYIYSGKPVIAVKYEESAPFENYAYLYDSKDINSLVGIFKILEENNYKAKRTAEESKQFALSNTWEKRVEELLKHFNSISKG